MCQAARSQLDVEVGQACPRPPQPLGTLEAQTRCPHPRHCLICLLRDQQAQATPCPPMKHTACTADLWAITRTHTPVKDADLPAGHVGSFRGNTKEPGRTLPLNVPGLDCQILTSDTNGIVCDEAQTGAEEAQLCSRSRALTLPATCQDHPCPGHVRARARHTAWSGLTPVRLCPLGLVCAWRWQSGHRRTDKLVAGRRCSARCGGRAGRVTGCCSSARPLQGSWWRRGSI